MLVDVARKRGNRQGVRERGRKVGHINHHPGANGVSVEHLKVVSVGPFCRRAISIICIVRDRESPSSSLFEVRQSHEAFKRRQLAHLQIGEVFVETTRIGQLTYDIYAGMSLPSIRLVEKWAGTKGVT